MKSILVEILNAVISTLEELFEDDMRVLPLDTRRILSHPEDRVKYIQAVDRIMKGSNLEEVHLSTGTIVIFQMKIYETI